MLTYRLALGFFRFFWWRLRLGRTRSGDVTPVSFLPSSPGASASMASHGAHARLAVLLVALSLPLYAGLSGCGGDDASSSEPGTGAAGGAGGTGDVGGSGGSTSDAAGTTGSGTTGPAAGGSGGSSTSASTSAGGQGGGPPEAIDFCGRLSGTSTLAGRVALEYELLSSFDCRVWDVASLYLNVEARDVFLNDLIRFNLALWGCATAPTEFGLVYWEALSPNAPPITSADVDVLVEDYLAVATPILSLSRDEIEGLTSVMRWLASERVLESSELSRSTCEQPGAGGAAGAGGEGGSPN